jgi:16S rRNA (cytidine1402-2'-O)-methyltransferase
MPGTLYLCSTPIGNLEDITLRVLRILREVDVIVAEDSRRTRQLLSHYGITTPLAPSLYQGVEEARTEGVLALLRLGKNVALVSDAGTPLISDPGFPLVRACIREGIPVVPVPGASAVLAALVGSGLPPDRFLFAGYPPRKIGERRRFLSELLSIPATVILFESPHRLLSTLEILAELDPERPTVVARELTKIHEEFVRGTASQVLGEFQRRGKVLGECVVLFGPETKEIRRDEAEILATYERFLAQGLASKEAIKEAARALGLPKREVYRILHQKLREAGPKDQENS